MHRSAILYNGICILEIKLYWRIKPILKKGYKMLKVSKIQSMKTLLVLPIVILLPKTQFSLSLASFLCFVLTSPQCYGIKEKNFLCFV